MVSQTTPPAGTEDAAMTAAPAIALAPADLSASDLQRAAAEETTRYRRGAAHDDRFAFELFRRALVGRNDEAWAALVALYNAQVTYWCARARVSDDDVEELASAAWAKFWRSFSAEKLQEANQTSAVLRYLKLCANSVAIDAARRRSAMVTLGDEAAPSQACSPIDDLLDQIGHQLLWRAIDGHLNGAGERVFMRLAFVQGMKPAEVQAARPDLFPTVQEVYRTRHCVLNRLRRSAALRRWQQEDLCATA
jgi:DNA-directed RNA polymerase specialized sigma24 family protein